jgi:hypothetical protein
MIIEDEIVPGLPDDVKPVIGLLNRSGNVGRAKALITGLVEYATRETIEPREWGSLVDEGDLHRSFGFLGSVLDDSNYSRKLGPETRSLLQISEDAEFSQDNADGLQALSELAGKVEEVSGAKQAHREYMDARTAGDLTCFYCDIPVDEGGEGTSTLAPSSTELGVYYGCEEDWELYGNPDEFI